MRAASAGDHSPDSRNVAEEGYALIEAIVAFMVAALALAFAFRAIDQSVSASRLAEERVIAVAYGELLMARVRANLPVNATGQFDQKYSWRLTITPYPTNVSARETQKLFRIDATIEWMASRAKQELTFSTLRLNERIIDG